MNTIHVLRPLDVDESRASVYTRTIVATTLLCAAVFVGCLLIGRAERRAGAPREQLASSPAAAVAGAAIPVRLATVPRIEVEAPVVRTPAHPSSHAPAATAPALVSAAPTAQAPVATTPSTPAPAPATPVVPATPVAQQQPAPVSRPSPPPASRAPASSSSETSGSTSFDSSG